MRLRSGDDYTCGGRLRRAPYGTWCSASLGGHGCHTPKPKVLNLNTAPATAITGNGADLVTGIELLNLDEGTGRFDFRAVRIGAGGISADHSHPHEQANYILSGQGRVELDHTSHDIGPDDFVYVPPDVRHVFVNTGDHDLVVLAARGPRD